MAQSGIAIAIAAHSIIAATLVWDKILLEDRQTQRVVPYVFWFGIISIFGPFLAFLGIGTPNAKTMALAFGSGVLDLISNFFYFQALKQGESSQTIAIMGGLSPIATALIGIPLIQQSWSGGILLGFSLMICGSFCMFFSEKIDIPKVLPPALLAAGLFGVTNVLQKMAFNATTFLTGYVFFTTGITAGSLLFLCRRSWRVEIFAQSTRIAPKSKVSYFANRTVERFGSFLVFLAISRANPALVDAIASIRYVIIFGAVYAITKFRPQWLKEAFAGRALAVKLIATVLVISGVLMVGLAEQRGGG